MINYAMFDDTKKLDKLNEELKVEWYEIPGSRIDLQPTEKSTAVHLSIVMKLDKGSITGNTYTFEPMVNLTMFSNVSSYDNRIKISGFFNPSKAMLMSSAFDTILSPTNMKRMFNYSETTGYHIDGKFTNDPVFSREMTKDYKIMIYPKVVSRVLPIPGFEIRTIRISKNQDASIILSESELRRISDYFKTFSCNASSYVMNYQMQKSHEYIKDTLEKFEYLKDIRSILRDFGEATISNITSNIKMFERDIRDTIIDSIVTTMKISNFKNSEKVSESTYLQQENEIISSNADPIETDEEGFTLEPNYEYDNANIDEMENPSNQEVPAFDVMETDDMFDDIEEFKDENQEESIIDTDPFLKRLNEYGSQQAQPFKLVTDPNSRLDGIDKMISTIYPPIVLENLSKEQLTYPIVSTMLSDEIHEILNNFKNNGLDIENTVSKFKNNNYENPLLKYVKDDIFNKTTLPGMFVYDSRVGVPVTNVILGASMMAAMLEQGDKAASNNEDITKVEMPFINNLKFGEKNNQNQFIKYAEFMIRSCMGIKERLPLKEMYMVDKQVLDNNYEYNYFDCSINKDLLNSEEIEYLLRGLGIVYMIFNYCQNKYINIGAELPVNFELFGYTSDLSVAFARNMLINMSLSLNISLKPAIIEMISIDDIVDELGWDKSRYYDAIANLIVYAKVIKGVGTDKFVNGPTCVEYIEKVLKVNYPYLFE